MFTRYMTYGAQFLISLAIASKLGPYYFGIYGVLNLVISYFGQINFGISQSLNVLLIHNKRDQTISNAYFLNSLTWYVLLSIILIVCYVILRFTDVNIGGKYNIDSYMPLVLCIAILTYIQSLFLCVARVRNDLNSLSFAGSIPVLLNFIFICFLDEDNLVLALLFSNLASLFIVLIMCIKRGICPQCNRQSLSTGYMLIILRKGLFLFIYNSCFYFIIISIRTIISVNYSIEEFGLFTFSYTIANAVMLLVDSFNNVVFPKTIDLMSSGNKEELRSTLYKMRVVYTSTSHLLVYIALLFYPFFLHFLPKYDGALQSLYLISLTVLMYTTSFGYASLIIAKNKERIASKISMAALLLNITISMCLVFVFKVEFSLVIIATLITYLVYSFICALEGEKLIDNQYEYKRVLYSFFPWRLFLPYSVAFYLSLIADPYLMLIPFIIFIVLNHKELRLLVNMIIKLTNNPNIIDV